MWTVSGGVVLTDLISTPGLLSAGGAGGIAALAVVAVLTGRLVPRSVLRDRIADKDKQIAQYREAAEVSTRAQGELAEQVRELTEMGRTTVALLSALQRERAG